MINEFHFKWTSMNNQWIPFQINGASINVIKNKADENKSLIMHDSDWPLAFTIISIIIIIIINSQQIILQIH